MVWLPATEVGPLDTEERDDELLALLVVREVLLPVDTLDSFTRYSPPIEAMVSAETRTTTKAIRLIAGLFVIINYSRYTASRKRSDWPPW